MAKILLWTLHRSGTHWLAKMLSDMIGTSWVYQSTDGNDYKEETIKQLYSHCDDKILVRHICLSPDELFRCTDSLGFKIILLYRDPRDVLASSVNMRKYKEGYRTGLPPFPDMSISEILRWEMQKYNNYFLFDLPQWIETVHANLFKVKYEDLSKDTVVSLEAIAKFLSFKAHRVKLEQIVQTHEFKASTSRAKGKEDKKEHTRKGIVGDYKNQFSLDEQNRMTDLLKDALIKMDYVP